MKAFVQEGLYYAKKTTQNMTDKEWRRKQIIDRYGPDATLPVESKDRPNQDFDAKTVEEYTNIKLPVPNGLSPELVAMVAMGAAMNTEKYDLTKTMTASSTAGTDLVTFNQAFHYMNIACDDGRVRGFSDILIDSRKEAQKAPDALGMKQAKAIIHKNNVLFYFCVANMINRDLWRLR